jgi:hypothetical protein
MPVDRKNVTKAKDYNETIPVLAQKGDPWNFEIYGSRVGLFGTYSWSTELATRWDSPE